MSFQFSPPPQAEIPPELAAYYQTPTVLNQTPSLPLPPSPAPVETPRSERLNLRLSVLILAWVLVPVALLVMILINIFIGSQDKVGVGQAARATPFEVTADAVQKPGNSIQWTNFGTKATATGTWLIVPLTIKNTGNSAQELTIASFELSDSTGKVYPFSDRLESYAYVTFKGGQNLNTPIPAGGTVRTFLIYDVPLSASGFKLKINQGNQPVIDLGG